MAYSQKTGTMQHNIKRLIGFSIGATEGEIGKVEELYFDDTSWTIRYLVVKTGGWLSGRNVLIAPAALLHPDWDNKVFPVNLTKEQVENSPDIDTDKPVSRQQEIELYSYYTWPYTGNGGVGFYGGVDMMGMTDTPMPLDPNLFKSDDSEPTGDPHLRSTKEVKGYKIHGTDGEIGDVEDYIIDDESWKIRYLIVDTGNWLPGKKVLLSPKWIKEVSWTDSSVNVDIPIGTIESSPKYDPDQPLKDNYELNLHAHYGRPH
jgi:sporulation protein YlmC with PRC-barrel domain